VITSLTVEASARYAGQIGNGGLIGNANTRVEITAGTKIASLVLGVENSRHSITQHADAIYAEILAGYSHDTTLDDRGRASSADADIVAVRINGNLVASSIVAGVQAGADGFFGTADDSSIFGGIDARANKSVIGSVVIRGDVVGTGQAGDHYGIVAESIGKITVDGAIVRLSSRVLDNVNLDGTTDVSALEVR
jgi:hypothetical protein